MTFEEMNKKLNGKVCHIGMLDVDDCKRVVELCKPLVKQ